MILVESYTHVVHRVEPSDPNLYGCSGMGFVPHLHKQVELEAITVSLAKEHFGSTARLCKRCFPGRPEGNRWV